MKALFISLALVSLNSGAATVHCQTFDGPQMKVVFDTKLEHNTTITSLKVDVPGDHFEQDSMKADLSYRPQRGNHGLRFNFRLLSESADFSGYVHGMILPLGITTKKFKAIGLSSDDSYHDGIVSYYPMNCQVL